MDHAVDDPAREPAEADGEHLDAHDLDLRRDAVRPKAVRRAGDPAGNPGAVTVLVLARAVPDELVDARPELTGHRVARDRVRGVLVVVVRQELLVGALHARVDHRDADGAIPQGRRPGRIDVHPLVVPLLSFGLRVETEDGGCLVERVRRRRRSRIAECRLIAPRNSATARVGQNVGDDPLDRHAENCLVGLDLYHERCCARASGRHREAAHLAEIGDDAAAAGRSNGGLHLSERRSFREAHHRDAPRIAFRLQARAACARRCACR